MARTKPKSLKKDKKYKDAPRYKTIYGYEDEIKFEFKKTLLETGVELESTMKKMLK